jgi:predicted  nucleic acid-binding Zn-ribbon protein
MYLIGKRQTIEKGRKGRPKIDIKGATSAPSLTENIKTSQKIASQSNVSARTVATAKIYAESVDKLIANLKELEVSRNDILLKYKSALKDTVELSKLDIEIQIEAFSLVKSGQISDLGNATRKAIQNKRDRELKAAEEQKRLLAEMAKKKREEEEKAVRHEDGILYRLVKRG